ncbi:Hpt domain-containing protein [Sulfurimonas sp.]|uniref:Hpt domain-containing protein n=1 Tax=Sulfurimonas sp. TaxID=2022749 RepID=UPI00261C61EA|nr:Hpt domain-containing protein [Sulfurimonas sp.]
MLIYNFQKEFFGIDAADLQTLGYNDLSALRAEATDIADLFVKTPGYIHNFKHVHWIDFVACSDASEIQRVIIHANGKHFRATVSVTNGYLIENTSAKAYFVYLHNLHQLNNDEIDNLQHGLSPAITTHTRVLEQKDAIQQVDHQPKPKIKQEVSLEPTPVPVAPAVSKEAPSVTVQAPTIEDNSKIDIDFEETKSEIPVEPVKEKTTKLAHNKEKFDNGYLYDPALASKELGLPVDLIEEFIQDFIAQADDFKDELYASLEDGDIDNVKSLSHKLKGVAANLRVEDAFETLSVINTTSDIEVIKTNLDLFYKIMAKLAGEEVESDLIDEIEAAEEELIIEDTIEESLEEVPEAVQNENTLDTDDDFMLDFKEDEVYTPEPKTDVEQTEDLSLGFKDDFTLEPEMELEETEPELATETLEILPEPETKLEVEPEVEVLYSKTKIANEIGLDQESFNELFNDYIQESFSLLDELKKSLENDNLSEIKIEVSKLRGMSENMRVNDFDEEIKHLMFATDHQERTKAVQKIEAIMKKLSEQGE